MGANRLTGTVWHVEKLTRQDSDDKRHRSRCVYYRKSDAFCHKCNFRCFGSAHCQYYQEPHPLVEAHNNQVPLKSDNVKTENPFPVGCKVRHTVFGIGTVSIVGAETLVVTFADGLEKKLNVKICLKQKILEAYQGDL